MRKLLLCLVAIIATFCFISCKQDVEIRTYTVTFDANGAQGEVPDPIVVKEGDSFTIPSKGDLLLEGLYFLEWNTREDGSGKSYEVSQEVSIDDNLKLYAIWTSGSLKFKLHDYYYSVSCLDKTVSSVVIPRVYNGLPVEEIESNAFLNCSKLSSVYIPSSITQISESAFFGCDGLQSVNVEEENRYYFSEGNCLIVRDTKELLRGCMSSEIPDDVKTIGNSAFSGCCGLTSVTIPEGVTSIGNSSFYNCNGLTSITIPSSVTSIGDEAFYYCSGLTNVKISEGVTSIGDWSFGYCSSLTGITIPSSVTSIGSSAFYGCSSLTGVTIPEGVTSIGDSSFYNCNGLTCITIPSSVSSIGNEAFSGCSGIKSVVLNDYVCRILSMRRLFPRSYETIESVVISEGVTGIEVGAFRDCSGLRNITIPESVTSIGSSTFYWCSRLISITIPSSVASIGNYAFYGCSGLSSINYSGTCSQWNSIIKGSSWNSNTGNYTLLCTDGDIAKN